MLGRALVIFALAEAAAAVNSDKAWLGKRRAPLQ
ncbi:unnamed protein product, partial [Mesorhabditis spiculigera]